MNDKNGFYQILDLKNFELKPKYSCVFEQADDGWILTYGGETAFVKNSAGMKNIGRLIEKPKTVFEAEDLIRACGEVALSEGVVDDDGLEYDDIAVCCRGEDVNAVMDDKGKALYRKRLVEIKEELSSAKQRGDVDLAEKLEEELDLLYDQLRRDTMPSGKSKRFSDKAKKIKDSVRKNIEQSIKKIHEQHPNLAEHLSECIKTQNPLYYMPTEPIEWRVVILR